MTDRTGFYQRIAEITGSRRRSATGASSNCTPESSPTTAPPSRRSVWSWRRAPAQTGAASRR
ncbi:MAG: hypothetical protein ACJ8CR_29180 [Roseiflexaceae bacterium]